MHMEIAPKRQSFPRRFISFSIVATQRAPELLLLLLSHIENLKLEFKDQILYKEIRRGIGDAFFLEKNYYL